MGVNWQSDMEAVIDRFFEKKHLERDVPGVAVSVVRDGEVLLSGYSFADRESKRAVDPHTAVFHAGSLAGLFTVTAALQLYERGRLALDDDVNRYTGNFRVPNPFPSPITVADLMTHTSGFGERTHNAVARFKYRIQPLEQILQADLKPPVVEPGKMITYSAWNMALLGYIIERITAMPFARYVEENILVPLEMTSTTFRPTLPDDLMKRFTPVYYDDRRALVPMPFLYSTAAPADGLTTSAGDMAKFMMALLGHGHFGEKRILKEPTVAEMFCVRRSSHKLLAGAAYGFMEFREFGKYGLLAEGMGLGVRSRVFLIPDGNTGLCILANASSLNICEGLTAEFVREFYRIEFTPPAPPTNFTVSADRFVGQYQYVGHDTQTVAKVRSLLTGVLQVDNNNDGTLTIAPLGPDEARGGFIEVTRVVQAEEPLVYQRYDNAGRIAFEEDAAGLIRYLHAGSGNLGSYRKLAPQDTQTAVFGLFGFCMVMFSTGALIWLVGTLTTPVHAENSTAWFAGLVGGIASALNLVFGGGTLLYVLRRRYGLPAYAFVRHIPRTLRYLFGLLIPSVVLTFALALIAVLALQYEYWDGVSRLHYLGLAAASIIFLWLVNKLNLYYTRL